MFHKSLAAAVAVVVTLVVVVVAAAAVSSARPGNFNGMIEIFSLLLLLKHTFFIIIFPFAFFVNLLCIFMSI